MSISLETILGIICLLASITVYFQSTSELYLKIFPVYLFVAAVMGEIGPYLQRHNKQNVLLYTFFIVSEFIFYFFVLYQIIKNKKIKKIIINILWIYPVLAMINTFLIQKAQGFDSTSYAVGCLLVAIMCIFYFYELFQFSSSNKLSREPSFWICTGILFNYCCLFPIFSFVIFFHNPPLFIIKNLEMIRSIINIFTYLLFTIAFLCRIKINKSMLQS